VSIAVFYLIPVFLILIVFAAFNSDAFVKNHRLGLLFGMFLLFGWGSLPFVYVIQFVAIRNDIPNITVKDTTNAVPKVEENVSWPLSDKDTGKGWFLVVIE
jgi:hypothetical protein